LTWTAPEAHRDHKPPNATERDALQGFLDFHRQTLLQKCQGLTADQLRTRSVDPSGLSLLGLVRHLTEVERWWFRRVVGGEDLADIYCAPDNVDGDLDDVGAADPEADFAAFAEEIRLADAAVAKRGLDDTFYSDRRKTDVNIRWVYLHMIEEYARHNGHADLLRERIDGSTGE
jgi:uncharacterized damage-inducible protein DinB